MTRTELHRRAKACAAANDETLTEFCERAILLRVITLEAGKGWFDCTREELDAFLIKAATAPWFKTTPRSLDGRINHH